MCIANRAAASFYKLLVLLILGSSIFLYSGLLAGRLDPWFFGDYTVLFALLCMIYYFFAVIASFSDFARRGVSGVTAFAGRTKGALIVSCLSSAGFHLYSFFLEQPLRQNGTPPQIDQIILLFAIPFLILLDYFLFDRKGRFRMYDPFLWLLIPGLFYLAIFIRANFGFFYPDGSLFPYHFLDPYKVGWLGFSLHTGYIVLLHFALGYLLVLIDRKFGKAAKKKQRYIHRLKHTDSETNFSILDGIDKVEKLEPADKPKPLPMVKDDSFSIQSSS